MNEGTAARGGLLSAVYAIGLGIPFILAALAYDRMLGAFAFVRRHQVWVTRVGGLMMIAVGVLLLTGWWDQMVTWVQLNLVSSFEVSV
jgi:cytochrome c-type biogenesis protein